MMKTLMKLILSILFGYKKTSDLALENLALRQQVAIMKRSAKRPDSATEIVSSASCLLDSGETGRSH